MSIRKPWTPWDGAASSALPVVTGVFEIGDAEGNVVYVGVAGARERFGLRSAIQGCFGGSNPVVKARGSSFRYEVTTMYASRHVDLLLRHEEQSGGLPEGNTAPGERLPTALGHYRRSRPLQA